MSFYHPDRSLPRRFGLIQASFLQSEGLPFAEVLSEDQIQQAFADEGVDFPQEEDEIYTPPLTLLFRKSVGTASAQGRRVFRQPAWQGIGSTGRKLRGGGQ